MASRLGVWMRELWTTELENLTGLWEPSIQKCFKDLMGFYDKLFPDNHITAPLKFRIEYDKENTDPNLS